MHFVYKTDNLFRSIRVSYGYSSVTKGFHFLNLLELHSFSVFEMHHSKPHHQFSTLSDFICYFSCIYWFFSTIRPWNWKAFQMNSEKVKVGMVTSFHPHSMCKKVERVTAKTRCTSCTKRTIYFEVSGFHTETRLLQRDFIFWTFLNSRLFLCSKFTIQSHIINFQPFLTSFVIFHAFTNYFEQWDHKIEKHYKWTLKRL